MLVNNAPWHYLIVKIYSLKRFFANPQKTEIRKSSKTERRFCRQNRFADFIVVADCVWLVGIYEAIFSRVRCVSKGKSMSLNTDDLKKFEQGVPEKISLSGSFDRNVPRNIRLMTSSAEFFRIDSAEKKLSVCLDWRCTLRKNIIEFIVVVMLIFLMKFKKVQVWMYIANNVMLKEYVPKGKHSGKEINYGSI